MEKNYFDPDKERMPRSRIEALQIRKLQELCEKLEDRNRFYTEKLKGAGLSFGDMRTLDDLFKVPFTTKSELMEAQDHSPQLRIHEELTDLWLF